MIGFHQISLITFIRNFALYYSVKKFGKFEQFPSKYHRTAIAAKITARKKNHACK